MTFPVDLPLASPSPHRSTCEDFGVVRHVRGGEGLSYKVGDPIMDLVVICCDETTLLEVQGLADCEGRPKAITMGRQARRLDAIVREEGFPPILHP